MKMRFLIAYAFFLATLSASSIDSLEAGFNSPWTTLKIAFAVDPGCTPIETVEELVISRKDDQMTIFGKKTDKKGVIIYTASRPLSKNDLNQITQKLSEFYQQANREIDTNEYFASLPETERGNQLNAYYKKHGRPIGGFGGTYFFIQFDPNSLDSIILNAFKEPATYDAYRNWIRSVAEPAPK